MGNKPERSEIDSPNNNNPDKIDKMERNHDNIAGKALEFNGRNSFVTIENLEGIDGSSVTVSCWIYPYSFNNDYPGLIQGPGVSFHCTGPAYRSRDVDQRAAFYVVPYERSREWTDPEDFSARLRCNTWYHIAAVYKTDGTTKLFVNGIVQSTSKWPAPIKFQREFNKITVGAIFPRPTDSHHFDGLISHVTIWGAALSDEQIPMLRDLNFTSLPRNTLAAHMPAVDGQLNPNLGPKCLVTLNNTSWVPSSFPAVISAEIEHRKAMKVLALNVKNSSYCLQLLPIELWRVIFSYLGYPGAI